MTGEDGRAAGQACSLLLAAVGREPADGAEQNLNEQKREEG
jgi:hypothetical protein